MASFWDPQVFGQTEIDVTEINSTFDLNDV